MADKHSSSEQNLEPSYVLNNGEFWNKYVIDWEKTPENEALQYLGNEIRFVF